MRVSFLQISYKIKRSEEATLKVAMNKICLMESVDQIISSMIN